MRFFLLVLIAVAAPVHAAMYYENIHYIQSTSPYNNYNNYNYQYQYPYTNQQQFSGSRCLYANSQGQCMIEQFFDPSNYNPPQYHSAPVYDRNYLYNERRYSNRDDDDDDDDYNYRYFDDRYDDDDDYDDEIPDSFFDDDDDDDDD